MSFDSAFAINHELKKNGFATLDEAGPLISQLAFCVRDDRHLRTLINACDPAERRHMYDALAPNLRFKARPFADYLIEIAQDAEARQLPVIAADGKLLEFKPAELRSAAPTDEAIAAEAVNEALATEHLAVVCLICTREEVVDGLTKEDAVRQLREKGWRMGFKRNADPLAPPEAVEICPACVRKRAPRRVLA
jgi:hypothetical protein